MSGTSRVERERPMSGVASKIAGIVALLAGVMLAPAYAQQTCRGDCNLDGAVTVDELVFGVQIFNGLAPLDDCVPMKSTPAHSCSTTGGVCVSDIVAAVRDSLYGCRGAVCGDNVIDLGETCDGVTDDGPCNTLCRDDCTCPEPICGNGVLEATEKCEGAEFNRRRFYEIQEMEIASDTPLTCDDRCEPQGFFTSYCRFFPCSVGRCMIFGPRDIGTCITREQFLERYIEICRTDPFTCQQIDAFCARPGRCF